MFYLYILFGKFLLVNRSVSDPQRKKKSSSRITKEESMNKQSRLENKMNAIEEVNSPQRSCNFSQNSPASSNSSGNNTSLSDCNADKHADLTYVKKGISCSKNIILLKLRLFIILFK